MRGHARTPLNEQSIHTGRGETAAAARELGMWLQALLTYFEPAAGARVGRAGPAADDYHCETRVVRDAFIRCLQLLASPAAEEPFADTPEADGPSNRFFATAAFRV